MPGLVVGFDIFVHMCVSVSENTLSMSTVIKHAFSINPTNGLKVLPFADLTSTTTIVRLFTETLYLAQQIDKIVNIMRVTLREAVARSKEYLISSKSFVTVPFQTLSNIRQSMAAVMLRTNEDKEDNDNDGYGNQDEDWEEISQLSSPEAEVSSSDARMVQSRPHTKQDRSQNRYVPPTSCETLIIDAIYAWRKPSLNSVMDMARSTAMVAGEAVSVVAATAHHAYYGQPDRVLLAQEQRRQAQQERKLDRYCRELRVEDKRIEDAIAADETLKHDSSRLGYLSTIQSAAEPNSIHARSFRRTRSPKNETEKYLKTLLVEEQRRREEQHWSSRRTNLHHPDGATPSANGHHEVRGTS